MMMGNVLGVGDHMFQQGPGSMRELSLHRGKGLQRQHKHQEDGNDARHRPQFYMRARLRTVHENHPDRLAQKYRLCRGTGLRRQYWIGFPSSLPMSLRTASPALVAALLFGASTPLAKALTGSMSPLLLAGLLYLGSGVGLALVLAARRAFSGRTQTSVAGVPEIPRNEVPWLLAAILAGGVAGPALLMTGLATTSAASASLLLNVEGVFTAVIAWIVFKENADRRIVLGMIAIVTGGLLLSWQPDSTRLSVGALLIIGACLCWAIDNNLTRKVSSNDAILIACLKGLVAGLCNTGFALAAGAQMPTLLGAGAAMIVGFAGYGVSLALFVVGLRQLGTARTGAYFSVAPLFGVILSFVLWPEAPGILFWIAGALMALGVWFHLREHHEHEHIHEALEHSHVHRHDHDFPWDGSEPHRHWHRHEPLVHKHPHYPDIHHRHLHRSSPDSNADVC